MRTLREVLMERDDISAEQADALIADAKLDMNDRLAQGKIPDDICGEWFGLEPDYIMDLVD